MYFVFKNFMQQMLIIELQNNSGLGYKFKANGLLVGLGLIDGVPSVGIFLKDPTPYLREFWRKLLKTPNG